MDDFFFNISRLFEGLYNKKYLKRVEDFINTIFSFIVYLNVLQLFL
jgi:hypothetical protein